jgi:tyrosinase
MSAHTATVLSAHARALRQRKNVEQLSVDQLASLREAYTDMQALTDDRGYWHWAGIHGLPLPQYCQHNSRLFLPWHRAYLYFFELAMRDQAPAAALAWWDWTSPRSHREGLPGAYSAARVERKKNPLHVADIPPIPHQPSQPDVTVRDPQAPTQLPSPATIRWLLGLPDFLDFQGQLEQVHNSVHVWVGGTMGEIPWAAYDPIFYAHHTMIDRIWHMWQLRHPNPQLSSSWLQQALPPFPMTVAQTLDIKTLGYRYASSTTHAGAGG